jgi:hypothetical protein
MSACRFLLVDLVTHRVGSLRTSNDNLLNPQLHRRLNNIISSYGIRSERLIIRNEQVPSVRSEVNDSIGRSKGRKGVFAHVEVGGKCIEYLSGLCEVAFESVDVWIIERD